MRTIVAPIRHEAEATKGSRFIATAAPATSEDEAKALLGAAHDEMPDASHHCWAWRIASPSIDRAGDAGEPGGSAGRPILAQIAGRDLVDTAVVVTRYFGGTKLGVGGLVRAYGGAAAEALELAKTARWRQMTELEIRHVHADTDAIVRAMAQFGVQDLGVNYGESVHRRISLAADDIDALDSALADATAGRVRLS